MACIVNNGKYIEFVALGSDGNPLFWTLSEGEEVVDVAPPSLRSEWTRDGLLKPILSGDSWVEGATPEELAAWDAEHPVVEPVHEPDVWDEMAEAYQRGVQRA